ncbi:hypothetical protein ACO0RG_001353 [Hanseniaspora osmophila]|uniref:Transcription factor Iwr1 domain-containing protein n=1 Tax=Hanseniaspora osmophila TaxID=56408 RepID=A0A1E5RNA9_9ASCO|nr:hypothetical protein AWRI3579_g985 [Hanseniaspora osmophila]
MSRPSTPIITLDYTNVIVQEEPDEDTMNYAPSAFVGNAPVEIGECIVLSAGQELLYKDELQKYIASHQDHPIFTMIECEPEDEEEGFDEEEEEEDEDEDEEDEEDYSGYAGHRDNGGSAFALYYVEEPVSSQRELYNANKHSSNYGFEDYSENASDGFDFLEDGSDGSVYTYTYSTYQVEELDDEVEDVDMF